MENDGVQFYKGSGKMEPILKGQFLGIRAKTHRHMLCVEDHNED